jgi:hypothetical protein
MQILYVEWTYKLATVFRAQVVLAPPLYKLGTRDGVENAGEDAVIGGFPAATSTR